MLEGETGTVGRGRSMLGLAGWGEDCGFSSKHNEKLLLKQLYSNKNVFHFFFSVLFIFLLYNIVLVLSYIDMNQPWVYICSPSWMPPPPPSPSHPSGSFQCTSPEHPVSCIEPEPFVSHMIIYRFQCHSPKASHPHPLPQSPKDCSIHLCLFCCLTYRVIITIFLNSIYMC